MPVKTVPSMGWTPRSAAVSVLLAMEDHRKQAGLRLVQLREARGWNQEDLAHRADVSVKTVSRFENGKHDGRRSTIRKIIKALGVREDALMDRPVPVVEPNHFAELMTKLDEVVARVDALTAQLKDRGEPSALPLVEGLKPSGTEGSPGTPGSARSQKSRAKPRRRRAS